MSAVSAEVIEPVPAMRDAAEHGHRQDRHRVVADEEEAGEDEDAAGVDRGQHRPPAEAIGQRAEHHGEADARAAEHAQRPRGEHRRVAVVGQHRDAVGREQAHREAAREERAGQLPEGQRLQRLARGDALDRRRGRPRLQGTRRRASSPTDSGESRSTSRQSGSDHHEDGPGDDDVGQPPSAGEDQPGHARARAGSCRSSTRCRARRARCRDAC